MRRSFQEEGVHEVGSGTEIITVFVEVVDAGGSGTSCTEKKKRMFGLVSWRSLQSWFNF